MKNLIQYLKSLRLFLLRLIKGKVVIVEMEEKRKLIEHYRRQFKPEIFVESGTFLGDTINVFKNNFSRLISIELSQELADKARERFKDDKNIEIVQGNSGEIIDDIVKELKQPAIFWLDGHYSSEFFVGKDFIKTAKGNKDTPIIEELDSLLSSPVQHTILIDDARLFNGKGHYPKLKYLKQKVNASRHRYSFIVDKDIIQLIPFN